MKNLFDPMVIRGMDRIAQLIIEEEMKSGSPIPSPGELSQLLLMPEDIISRALLQLFYEGTLNGDPAHSNIVSLPQSWFLTPGLPSTTLSEKNPFPPRLPFLRWLRPPRLFPTL